MKYSLLVAALLALSLTHQAQADDSDDVERQEIADEIDAGVSDYQMVMEGHDPDTIKEVHQDRHDDDHNQEEQKE